MGSSGTDIIADSYPSMCGIETLPLRTRSCDPKAGGSDVAAPLITALLSPPGVRRMADGQPPRFHPWCLCGLHSLRSATDTLPRHTVTEHLVRSGNCTDVASCGPGCCDGPPVTWRIWKGLLRKAVLSLKAPEGECSWPDGQDPADPRKVFVLYSNCSGTPRKGLKQSGDIHIVTWKITVAAAQLHCVGRLWGPTVPDSRIHISTFTWLFCSGLRCLLSIYYPGVGGLGVVDLIPCHCFIIFLITGPSDLI